MSIKDFIKQQNKTYNGSAFTGIWIGHTTEQQACDMAIDVLNNVLERCKDEDMRTEELAETLEFLKGRAARTGFHERFRTALDIQEPQTRWQVARAALDGIKRQHGQT